MYAMVVLCAGRVGYQLCTAGQVWGLIHTMGFVKPHVSHP